MCACVCLLPPGGCPDLVLKEPTQITPEPAKVCSQWQISSSFTNSFCFLAAWVDAVFSTSSWQTPCTHAGCHRPVGVSPFQDPPVLWRPHMLFPFPKHHHHGHHLSRFGRCIRISMNESSVNLSMISLFHRAQHSVTARR